MPDTNSPTGSTNLLDLDGGNPNLTAERSRSLNFGVTYRPEFVSGLKFEASWFSIDYSQKIDRVSDYVSFYSVLKNAGTLGPLLTLHPTVAQKSTKRSPRPDWSSTHGRSGRRGGVGRFGLRQRRLDHGERLGCLGALLGGDLVRTGDKPTRRLLFR